MQGAQGDSPQERWRCPARIFFHFLLDFCCFFAFSPLRSTVLFRKRNAGRRSFREQPGVSEASARGVDGLAYCLWLARVNVRRNPAESRSAQIEASRGYFSLRPTECPVLGRNKINEAKVWHCHLSRHLLSHLAKSAARCLAVAAAAAEQGRRSGGRRLYKTGFGRHQPAIGSPGGTAL